MLSDKSKHILDVLFCVLGIVSGLSGGVSFSTLFSNEPAMMWAYYSGCMAFACMVIEMLRHHGMLKVCFTASSLWVASVYAILSLATTTLLFLIHLSVGIRNRESVTSKGALDHSDFIVAVWTFLAAKYCLKLYFVSKKSRQALLQQLSIFRAESPNFQAMQSQAPHADSLDSRPDGRRHRRAPDADRERRSSREKRRAKRASRRWRRSAEREDLLSDVSPMPSVSQLVAATDSESVGDMDEMAESLTMIL